MSVLAPAIIAGFILSIVILLSILSTACIILYRRYRSQGSVPIFLHSSPDLEKAPKQKTPPKRKKLLRKAPPPLPEDAFDPHADVFGPIDFGPEEHNHSLSTLNVTISPSAPRMFKVETEGGGSIGVEVRVTPPTPNTTRAPLPATMSGYLRRMRFAAISIPATQSVTESKWWSM
ncbi:hypothetical protein WOLCODRAFT_155141 [Wolfiporia cocos MD-104 SS10]|uniref:Uncharacterized protein n=1 Tax=Wolfiporia cocos (strain MD-104) TaxID=742152 RepID=A0A2H3K7S9_WOLCO|nr:hypothetical protein WOLCODRAFT_155141 [Wolfiporia cocos MD-104 SS10]